MFIVETLRLPAVDMVPLVSWGQTLPSGPACTIDGREDGAAAGSED